MTYTPHLKRKLYKTSLTKEEIVHPIELPAPDGAGKDQDYARPLQWHYIGDSVFVTLWDDWLSEFNKKNDDKFVLASSSDAKNVRALYDDEVKMQVDLHVNNKYSSADLVDASDDIKTDIASIRKGVTDLYDALVLLK